MSNHESSNHRRVLAWARSQLWGIERGALQTILEMASREHTPDFDAVLARQGERMPRTDAVQLREGVAIISITGPIFRYANFFTQISGATSIETAMLDLRAALDDPGVRAIVLNIDSQGGAVPGISAFAKLVHQASKPTVAFVDGSANSAAYWIASAAQWIVMSDTAIAGSIGVVASVLLDNNDRLIEVVSSQSPAKREDVRTDAGRAQIQKMVDEMAQVFVESVAAYRKVSASRVLSDFGRGGVLVGRSAVAAGLADQLGTLEEVISSFAGGGYGPAHAQLVRARAAEVSRANVVAIRRPGES